MRRNKTIEKNKINEDIAKNTEKKSVEDEKNTQKKLNKEKKRLKKPG